MLRCPTCGRRYAAGPRFCPDDGTALVADGPPRPAEAAPTPAPTPAPPRPSASSALGALLNEPSSDPPARPERPDRYAQPVSAPRAAAPPADEPGEEEAFDDPPRRSVVLRVVLVAVALIAVAAVAAVVLLRPNSLEQEAYDAIARGDLVTPERVSAYDFAQRLEAQSPNSAAAERVGAAAFGPLVVAADAFYARFYTTSEASKADWSRTARLMTWAAEINPVDGHVRARRAYAEARVAALAGDRDAARDAYEQAAEAWPEWALPPNSLGVLLADRRDTAGAIESYRKAARLDRAWPFPLSNLGSLYVRLDRYSEAVDVLEQAARLDPSRPGTHALLAQALAGDGRYDEAIGAAGKALQLSPAGTVATDGFDANRLRAAATRWQERLDAKASEDVYDGDFDDEGVLMDGEIIDEPGEYEPGD